ncbi:MAG: WYL domain-containing protein [Thermoleophilaceae bacterium]|nr:WYL domain-containing protein [Thermoleophilaceae bacterium]
MHSRGTGEERFRRPLAVGLVGVHREHRSLGIAQHRDPDRREVDGRRDSEGLRFLYRGRDGAEGRREVEPHSLVNLGRRWYLLAWDRGRRDWRTFRVDRLAGPAATGARFAAREPRAKDATAYVSESISAAPNRYEARVTVHAPAETVRGRIPVTWGSVEPIDSERCEYRTGDDDLDWLALRVAMLDADFDVHEPPELLDRLRALAGRVARAVDVE